jgi:hypothetical protein
MMTPEHPLTFILLDDEWRPVDRLTADLGWPALVGRLLAVDSRWLAIEQRRDDQDAISPRWPDIVTSRSVHRRLRALDIGLVDHVIHGRCASFSFRTAGLL